MSRTVIVFGPTGAVGSSTARTAAALGSKVVLAMRYTDKPVPGLAAEEEKRAGFSRVYADLEKPDTVHDAVKASGATHAFIYLAFMAENHMRATVEALKKAGVELVVFLSSFTVQGALGEIRQEEVIPYVHARVELNLEEVFGREHFVAVRGGSFASNTLQYKKGFEEGRVKIFRPDAMVDGIVPEDIGRVAGTVLARGPQDGSRAIYLYGPEMMSQGETARVIGEVLGREAEVVSATEEEAYKIVEQSWREERGMPEPVVQYAVARMAMTKANAMEVIGYPVSQEDLSNVEKYSGKRATTFKEWVEQNKESFTS